MDYPRGIHIETTGRCNAHCIFCPHDRSARKTSDMQPWLFDKILREIKEIPQPVIVVPFKLGEPMMDPQFSRRLLQINAVSNIFLEIHTNLNRLQPEFIRTLRKLKRVNHIWVSLNQYTAEDYKRTTGLKFERTLNNIQTLINARLPHRLVVGRVASHDTEDQNWVDWVRKVFPSVIPALLPRGNWCVTTPRRTTGPCQRTYELSICCDGRVALCCMDGLCEYSLGDVTTQHILEVYNSPQAIQMREMTERLHEPCKSCTFI